MPKQITAKMLADLARRKVGCAMTGIDVERGEWYVFVHVTSPCCHWKKTWLYFWYAHYGGAAQAKQAAWNFLMERPDKEDG